MGTKHSVPVTQHEGPTMPYSSFAISGASATATSAPPPPPSSSSSSSDFNHHHHAPSTYGKLSIGTATIRPHEGAGAGSAAKSVAAAQAAAQAAAEAARMTPLDIK